MEKLDQLDIFSYSNYRLFLADYIQRHYLERGKSYRAFSKRCDIKSPNYFQQVIACKKNMTPQTAEKVAEALHLSKTASSFFINLVKLDTTENADTRFEILGQLRSLVAKHKRKSVKDEKFHSRWVQQVIYSLAHTSGFSADPEKIRKAIRGSVPPEEVEQGLRFLKEKGYLEFDAEKGNYVPKDVTIESDNDLRSFDLQRNHNRFLQAAQLRLNDDLKDREFQGLTLAIPKSRLPILKEMMREFVKHVNDNAGGPEEADVVIRLQLAAFIIARFD